MYWCSEVLKVGQMITAAYFTITHRSMKTMRARLEVTVFARLRSIRCRLLCCSGRHGAAAADGAARGCGAV